MRNIIITGGDDGLGKAIAKLLSEKNNIITISKKEEYLDEGITTKEQYEKRAVELAEMPVGGNILGYKTKEGHICRYDKEKNDYVKADIEKGIRTMFKPDEGEAYYHRQQRKEGIEDE